MHIYVSLFKDICAYKVYNGFIRGDFMKKYDVIVAGGGLPVFQRRLLRRAAAQRY